MQVCQDVGGLPLDLLAQAYICQGPRLVPVTMSSLIGPPQFSIQVSLFGAPSLEKDGEVLGYLHIRVCSYLILRRCTYGCEKQNDNIYEAKDELGELQ